MVTKLPVEYSEYLVVEAGYERMYPHVEIILKATVEGTFLFSVLNQIVCAGVNTTILLNFYSQMLVNLDKL